MEIYPLPKLTRGKLVEQYILYWTKNIYKLQITPELIPSSVIFPDPCFYPTKTFTDRASSIKNYQNTMLENWTIQHQSIWLVHLYTETQQGYVYTRKNSSSSNIGN